MSMDELKERYLRDDLPIRLGNLAANLARIGNTGPSLETWPYIDHNIEESMLFIGWTENDLPVEMGKRLSSLHLLLARLKALDSSGHHVRDACSAIAKWSDEVIAMMRQLHGRAVNAEDERSSLVVDSKIKSQTA